MSCQWIDIDLVRGVAEKALVLFGAGKGSEELLGWLKTSRPDAQVLAVLDNNASLWGRKLQGHEIVSPGRVREFDFEKIIVTSISGAQSIAVQLREMGFKESEFVQVGVFPPDGYVENFRLLRTEMNAIGRWTEGLRCLHVGPGGFLGVEVLLHSLIAAPVSSIDKFAFAIHYPDITPRLREYSRIRDLISQEAGPGRVAERALARFDELLEKKGHRVFLDSEKIDFRYPVDVCSMPFPPESFDLVVSFALLEHVRSPDRAFSEIARVLKPGGVACHTIITADHRSFSSVGGFTPFSFRVYGAGEWEAMTANTFHQNRFLPIQWRRLFEEKGLTVEKYTVLQRAELTDEILQCFHPAFRGFSRDDLCDVNCRITAVKRG